MAELFLKINGYANYSVSDQGNIRNDAKCMILKHLISNNGYHGVVLCKTSMKLDRKQFLVHRLVALTFLDNPEKKDFVDHIDGDKNNNSLSNLRWATRNENNANVKKNIRNKSGQAGVYFNKRAKKWHSEIRMNNKKYSLGYFTDINDAILARKTAQDKYFGEYQNFETEFDRLNYKCNILFQELDELFEDIKNIKPLIY